MPDVITNLTRGMPVEIGKIDRELKQLWKQGEGAATRASLVNFAVYCEGAAAIEETTELISQFTRDHACRAILIATEPNAPERRVQAWISAHCHISRAGAKQVCCEQITFLLEGDARELIPNIVFSHLDSDLPLYLWWRGQFPAEPDEQLWKWVDRLFYDSRHWPNPRAQFASLRDIANRTRLTLRDLNWTRTLYLRQAISRVFDHPENLQQLPRLRRITITHAKQMRSAAVLLAGWLLGQLRLRALDRLDNEFHLARADENSSRVDLELQRGGDELAIAEVELETDEACFRFSRKAAESGFLYTETRFADGRVFHNLQPHVEGTLLALLDTELSRGTTHEIYLKVLAAAEPLW